MRWIVPALACVGTLIAAAAPARAQQKIDLRTTQGVEAVRGQWKYSDVRLVEVPATNQAASQATAYNIEPRAHGADFNDDDWEVIAPETLGDPRAGGRICFSWYRIRVTVPESARGKKVFFQTISDDYGEVWVDGKLPRKLGQQGGAVVAGFNAPNRVELTDPSPGKVYQLAIFGINGPISAAPSNAIFLREAFLEIR